MIKKLAYEPKKNTVFAIILAVNSIFKGIIITEKVVFTLTAQKISKLTKKVLQKEQLILAFQHNFGYNHYCRPPPGQCFLAVQTVHWSDYCNLFYINYLKKRTIKP